MPTAHLRLRKAFALLLCWLVILTMSIAPLRAVAAPILSDGLIDADQAQSVEGQLFENVAGNAMAFDSGDVPLGGVKVYAYWQDADGSISPTYYTTTRASDGKWAIFFPTWTDANGASHSFQALPTQRIRVTADPVAGYNLSYIDGHNMLSDSIQRDAVMWDIADKDVDNFMISYTRQPQFPPPAPYLGHRANTSTWVQSGAATAGQWGTISGFIFTEQERTGGWLSFPSKDSGDPPISGVRVVATRYSKPSIFDPVTSFVPVETKYTTSAADGSYAILWNTTNWDTSYFLVTIEPAGTPLGTKFPSSTQYSTLFTTQTPMSAADLRGESTVLVDAYVRNVNFAFWNNPTFDVTPYDTKDSPAKPGDTAQTSTTQLQAGDSSTYSIKWTDSTGTVVKECTGLIPSGGSLPSCPFTVPTNLSADTIYTATLYNSLGQQISADSFAARIVPPAITSPTAGSSTNDTTPTITGTGQPGASVVVKEGTTTLCTTTVTAGGTWTCDSSLLGAGSHTITATQGTQTSAPVTFTIDTTKPTINPIADQTVPVNTAITSITVSTNEPSTIAVSGLPSGVSFNPTTKVISGTPTVPGVYNVTVTATDAAGNVQTLTFKITVNPVAPTITAPATGTSTNNLKPPISGTGTPGASVTVTEGGTQICTATVQANGTWTCTPSADLTVGAHTITATQTLNGATSPAATSTFTIDTTPPTITAIPSQTVTVNDAITAVTVSTGDPTDVVTVSGLPAGVSYTSSTKQISGNPSVIGVFPVTVKATDAAGNVSQTTFTITSNPPAPVITGPTDGAKLTTGSPAISGTGVNGALVTVKDGTTTICTATVVNGTWTCTPSTPLPDGPHALKATQELNGATSGVSNTVNVTVDSTAPVVTDITDKTVPVNAAITPIPVTVSEPATVVVTGLPAGVTYTGGNITGTPSTPGVYNVTVTATDPSGNKGTDTFVMTVTPAAPTLNAPTSPTNNTQPTFTGTGTPGALITVKEGGTTLCTATVASDGTWACQSSVLTEGTHTVSATQTVNGVVSPSTPTQQVVIDTTAPVIGALPPKTVPVNQALTTPIAIPVTGASSVSVNGLPDGLAYANGEVTGTPTKAGVYTVTVVAVDAAGNSATKPFTLTVTPATPTITGPANGSSTNDDTPTFTGTGTPGATIDVKVGGVTVCTATVALNNTWSCTPTTALTPGSITATVTQTVSGAVSDPVSTTFTVDTTPPTLTVNGDRKLVVNTVMEAIVVTAEAGSTISYTTLPPGITWDAANSKFVGTPTQTGTYNVTVTATDAAGNSTSKTVQIIVEPTPGSPAILTPTNGALIGSTPSTVTVTGSAQAGSTITLKQDGVAISSCTNMTVPANGTWSCSGLTLTEGGHTFQADQTYLSVTTSSTVVNVTVDKTPPGVTDIPNQSGTVGVSQTIPVTITNGPATVTATGLPPGMSYSGGTINGTPTAPGTYTVTVTATDAAGNTGTDTFDYVVKPSTPTITGPVDGTVTNNTQPTITGTGMPGATVTVLDGTTPICSPAPVVGANGTWTCTPSVLGTGDHNLTVTQTLNGQTSATSAITKVTIDTTKPVITAIDDLSVPVGAPLTPIPVVVDTTPVTVSVSGLPDGVTYNTTTKKIEGTPVVPGVYNVVVSATDQAGNVGTEPFKLTVTPVTPTINPPSPNPTKDATPAFSGTGTPGATVEVKEGATVLCTATVDQNGNWTCSPTTNMGDGTHSVTADQVINGVTSPSTSAVSVTIDTAAPSLNDIPNTTVTSGTPITAIAVTVTGGPATVAVTGLPPALTYNTSTGKIEGTPTAPGSYPVTVTATDAAGNVGTDTFTLTVLPPSPAITGPAANSTVTTLTPAISGTGTPGAVIEVKQGSTVLCTTNVATDGTWTCTPSTNLPQGTNTVSVTQTVNGQTSVPSTQTFTVDTLGPVITAVPPKTGTAGQAIPSFTVTVDNTAVSVTASGMPPGVVWDEATRTFSGTPEVPGTYTVTLTAKDAAGNTTTSTFTFTVSPAVPVITGPTANQQTNNVNQPISGTGLPGAMVTVKEGSTTICVAGPVAADGTWTCSPSTPLAPGSHTVSATQTSNGVTSLASTAVTFVVDTTKPVIQDITDKTVVAGTPIPNISVVTEAGATLAAQGLPAGVQLVGTTISGTPTTPGTYPVTVTATDAAGNVGTDTFTITVLPTPGVPTITGPANNANVKDTTPTITGSGAPGATIDVKDGATTICSAIVQADGTWVCTPTVPLAQGAHTLVAEQTLANSQKTSTPITINIDSVAPVITQVPNTTGQVGTAITSIPIVTNDPTATLTTSPLPPNLQFVDTNGDGKPDTIQGTPGVAGTFPVTVTATDPAGNTSTMTFTITVAAPPPVILGPVTDTLTNNPKPPINGTAYPGSVVVVLDGTTQVCQATVTMQGTWACTPSTNLADGLHNLTAVSQTAGTTSSPSNLVKLTVDATKPVVTDIQDQAAPVSRPITPIPVVVSETANTVVTGLPPGLSFDGTNIVGTPTTPGSYNVTVTSTDPAGNVGTDTFVYTIVGIPGIISPVMNSYTNQTQPPIKGAGDPNGQIVVKENGVTICSTTVDAQGWWTCTPTAPLAEGQHSIIATQTLAGASKDSTANIFTVDLTKPTITDITDKSSVAGTAIAPISVTIGDNNPGVKATVSGLPDGLTYSPATGVIEGIPTKPGVYPVTVTVTDAAGNTTTDTFTYTVNPPAPVVTGPVGTSNSIPTIVTGTGMPGAVVTVSEGGTTLCTAVVKTDGTWSCSSDKFTEGTHTITTTQQIDGTTSGPSTHTFTVDTPPVIAPNPDQTVAAGTPIKPIEIKVNQPATITVENLPSGMTYDPNTKTITGTPSTPGAYPITIIAVDPGGQKTTQVVTITSRPNPPVITGPKPGSETDASPEITGTGEVGAKITVTENGKVICVAEVKAGDGWTPASVTKALKATKVNARPLAVGTWSCKPTSPLTPGPHELVASQTINGATSLPSAKVDIVVKSATPVPTPSSPPGEPATPPGRNPAETGSGVPPYLPWLSLAMLVSGAWLLLWGCRRRVSARS